MRRGARGRRCCAFGHTARSKLHLAHSGSKLPQSTPRYAMSTRQKVFAFFVVLVALGLRGWMLDLKPAHFDEGVNGAMIDEMRARGFYEYQADNYHGPLHFYVLFAGQQMFGRSLWVLRMPTVLIGVATVAMMF